MVKEKRIIFHAFQWKLRDIIDNLPIIKRQHFNYIQISPIQPTKDDGLEYWKLYQPIDFSIGNTQIGSKEELIELCENAAQYGIKIIADVVLRHLAGNDDGTLYPPHEKDNQYIVSHKEMWLNPWAGDVYNRHECIYRCFGVPALNYNNEDLQKIYIKFLTELKECGVSGFRIDMGKHFALPREGGSFWTNVMSRFSDMFNYAECLELSKDMIDEYCQFINVSTDSYGSDNSKLIVYLESHDTYWTWRMGLNMEDSMRANEWRLLVNNNCNCLYFAREFETLWMSDEIRNINEGKTT